MRKFRSKRNDIATGVHLCLKTRKPPNWIRDYRPKTGYRTPRHTHTHIHVRHSEIFSFIIKLRPTGRNVIHTAVNNFPNSGELFLLVSALFRSRAPGMRMIEDGAANLTDYDFFVLCHKTQMRHDKF